METCIAMDMRCDDPVLAGRSRPSCLLCSALALRHTPRACRAIALGWAYVHLSPPGPATLRTCTHLSGAPVPGEHAAGMVQLAPTPAMDEVTFRSDTVLSDVHLYTPNQRHLMVRLNGVGQPVFLSQFQLLWSQEASGTRGGDHRDPRPEEPPLARPGSTGSSLGSGHSSEGLSIQAEADSTGQEGVGALLDEDGDLDVVRRPQATSDPDPTGFPRLKVHPMILTQDEDVTGDDAPESSPHSVIRIEHTMATPLEDVGKQVWRGALLLADYILFRRDLFQGRTVLELGAGTGLASIVAATMAHTVYCTAVPSPHAFSQYRDDSHHESATAATVSGASGVSAAPGNSRRT
ncbi:methyltransferase-like protein 22 isoform X4 [Tupaia chinensis]|uniref:methyltransferase-like protein 22 isoform X4 n=1 Tax=Tupaia chinensis TaxID=246437 RepID=UPI000FFB34A3|nr:methyltransferase-like protein 22 isoform X4 [Tupaia chinensis]